MKTRIALTLLFGCLYFTGIAAEKVNSSETDSTFVYEKLYLHTDREIYSPGDDIWFKSYLVSGMNNQLIPGYKNIYVQLIAENGEVVDSCLLLSLNGVAVNDFPLDNSLKDGTYIIRAYTKYLLNFGEESLFHQKITVARADDTPDFTMNQNARQKIDVAFLPEGGNLVLNAANTVAFKAIDESGRGVQVTGKVVDNSGAEIVSFETRYKGMGQFMIMPEEGKTYFAKINGHPEFTYQFPAAKADAIALHYQSKGANLQFVLNRNFKMHHPQKLILTANHKNVELFREEIEMEGFQYPVEFFKGNFPLGISKITVFDGFGNALAERLVFVRNANKKMLEVASDKKKYPVRDKVKLDISSFLEKEDSLENGLSVAVVNENYFNEGGISQTIESYLLLDSELKGPLESPAAFFRDEENISAGEKLDLAMLVNGWRRYYWDELQPYAGSRLPNWSDAGLAVSGRVEKLFGTKPVQRGTVTFGPFSNLFLILKDTTNKNGEFRFDRVYLKDSAQIMINATNSNGRNRVEVFHQPQVLFNSSISVPEMNRKVFDISVPEKFYQANYYRRLAEREYELEYGSILLQDVDIAGKKSFAYTYITGNWGYPDRSYKLAQEANTSKYIDLLDYIEYNVPAVYVQGDSVIYRNAPVPFLLDGLAIENDRLRYIQLGDILQLDFYNNSANIARFGSELSGVPASAVFSILTKSGTGNFYDEFERIVHGRIVPTFNGFKQAREFYSPQYPLHKLDELDSRKPDFRPTLYWNPDVFLRDGKATLEFYTSDMMGRYSIIVEGITEKGSIVYETSSFEVTAQDESE